MLLSGGVDYDSEDLQYESPGEGAFYGLLAGALLGAAIGAPIGALAKVERWKTVSPSSRPPSACDRTGLGAEVSITRHLAVALDARVNYPIDFWYLIDPYEKRMSLRPSIGMVARF